MQRDGVALVKFLKWLEDAVPTGRETEISIDKKLHAFRAAQPLYMGESVDTIAGYKEHGAIVHYEATPETDVTLKAEGFLLLDSGAQYLDGTTDITRTIALGNLTEEEKTDYTLILKGHIALATAVFPEGTRGAQLDVLARLPIWKQHMNYLHGTGHGVGHFLNVHEGPQSIRMNENPIPLQPGMVTSNEPGVYKAGSHGIRTENLLLTVPAGEGMFGNYLKFETITLCPICRKGIIKELLTAEEIEWLNEYHRVVYEKLSPDLDNDEKEWLKEACKPLKSVRGFTPEIGENCFLADNATIIGDVKMGRDCSIWFSTVLRGDVNSIRIGNGVNIQDGSVLHTLYEKSTIEIGDHVSVGHNVTIHGAAIRDYALIGMGSTILDHAVVGEGAIVAAGSLVLSNTVIEPGSIWGGVPAKFIKKVDPEQAKELNQKIAHNYLMYSSWYKE